MQNNIWDMQRKYHLGDRNVGLYGKTILKEEEKWDFHGKVSTDGGIQA
jgi:hypothetical protein